MKTDDLIAMLATGAGPATPVHPGRSFAPVLLAGLAASIALSLAVRGLVPAQMWGGSALWTKLVYAAALAFACVWLVARLARPATARGKPALVAGLVVMAMLLAGLVATIGVAPPERLRFVMGSTALVCPWAIPVLALPTLAGLLRLLREAAPTQPARAGFAAGLLAGAVGAAGYALSCAEVSTAFIAVWYSLGILLSGGMGALLGARVLRW
jgi:hypothetical protein